MLPPIWAYIGGYVPDSPSPATASGERSPADVIGAVSLGSLRDAPTHWMIPRRQTRLEIYCVIGAASAVELEKLAYEQRNRIGWIFQNEYRAQS